MEKKIGHILSSHLALSVPLFVSSVCFAQSTPTLSVHQSVHAGVMSPVYVQTVDNAVCALHPRDSSDPSVTTRLFTDDRDIIEFQITLMSVGDVADLVMDCSANDGLGLVLTHSIEVRAVPAQDSVVSNTDSLKDVPLRGRKLPPLKTNELNLSNAELMARGYPSRPDPLTSPAQHKHWKEIVSRTWTIAEPRHAAHRWDDVKAYRGISSANHSSWEGYVLKDQVTCDGTMMNSPVYTYIEGQFAAPSPSGGYGHTTSKMSEWIGIGASSPVNPTVLLQAGADGIVTCYQYYCVTSVSLWMEDLPDSLTHIMTNSGTQPGDWLEISITAVDAYGEPSSSGPNGRLWFFNSTRGIANADGEATISLSRGNYTSYYFAGESASWIVERVKDPDCTHWPASSQFCLFANFGSAHLAGAAAFASSCPWPLNYLQPGNSVEKEKLFSCDRDPTLCPYIASVTSGSETYDHRADMTFRWLNFY